MENQTFYIAIIGGSIAGSEAAYQLAEKGYHIVIFDQMPLPYGKIEDGLPKWHIKLRDKEEELIDQKLQHPLIRFVPMTRLGKEIEFQSLIDEWKFSALILAIGAWKDRPLAIPGIDNFINQGLIYQNQLIKWFNHYHEKNYSGPKFSIPDGTAIIGGGLSSIDVIKIIQIVTVQDALLKKGIHEDIFTLEKGINRILEKHELSMEDLGLKGATLFYRKAAQDMPLKPYSDPSQKQKAQEVSQKMLAITKNKFKFNFQPNAIAVNSIIEDNELKGVVFQKTLVKNDRAIPIEGSEFEFKTPLVISSIGSLPEAIQKNTNQMNGWLNSFEGGCRLKGYSNVFAIGNAVTGRGNIKESRMHGRESAQKIVDKHLDPKEGQFQDFLRNLENKVDDQIEEINESLQKINPISKSQLKLIDKKISDLQEKIAYNEDYYKWKKEHLWERLEDSMITQNGNLKTDPNE